MQQQRQRDTPKQTGSHRARQLQHNKVECRRSGAQLHTGGCRGACAVEQPTFSRLPLLATERFLAALSSDCGFCLNNSQTRFGWHSFAADAGRTEQEDSLHTVLFPFPFQPSFSTDEHGTRNPRGLAAPAEWRKRRKSRLRVRAHRSRTTRVPANQPLVCPEWRISMALLLR